MRGMLTALGTYFGVGSILMGCLAAAAGSDAAHGVIDRAPTTGPESVCSTLRLEARRSEAVSALPGWHLYLRNRTGQSISVRLPDRGCPWKIEARGKNRWERVISGGLVVKGVPCVGLPSTPDPLQEDRERKREQLTNYREVPPEQRILVDELDPRFVSTESLRRRHEYQITFQCAVILVSSPGAESTCHLESAPKQFRLGAGLPKRDGKAPCKD